MNDREIEILLRLFGRDRAGLDALIAAASADDRGAITAEDSSTHLPPAEVRAVSRARLEEAKPKIDRASLEPHQERVAGFLCKGYSDRKIAQQMRVQRETVTRWVKQIMIALGVETRGGLASSYLIYCIRHGKFDQLEDLLNVIEDH